MDSPPQRSSYEGPGLREARKLCGGGYSPYCSKECAEAAEKEFEALLKRMSEDSPEEQDGEEN